MINRKDFAILNKEVRQSVNEAFDYIKENSIDHNYILFLADGEYQESISDSRWNPYVIDSQTDKYKDESRQRFFMNFMKLFYSFPKGKSSIDDSEYRLNMEMMIYTHIWESKPFLKQLYRFSSLTKGNSYQWKVEVPEMSKYKFIIDDITKPLKSKQLSLANIVSKGFHSSLRNAFAHSEYQFDDYNKIIRLDTYKGAQWDISSISYNDWTKRFVYSALLSYHFFDERYYRRYALINDFGRDYFSIVHPITETRFKIATIYYDRPRNAFNFYKSYN